VIVSAICSILLTAGSHALECRAEYLHVVDGVRYEHEVAEGIFIVGPMQVICSGEGFPVRVTLKDLGSVVCTAEVDLFSDDFESGTTQSWTSVVP
jgi:hypothetical protein